MFSVPPTLFYTHHFSQGDDRRKLAFTDSPMALGNETLDLMFLSSSIDSGGFEGAVFVCFHWYFQMLGLFYQFEWYS